MRSDAGVSPSASAFYDRRVRAPSKNLCECAAGRRAQTTLLLYALSERETTLLTGTNTKTTNSQIPPRRRASGDFGEHPQIKLLGVRSTV